MNRINKSFTGGALVSRFLRDTTLNAHPWHVRWKPVTASTEKDLTNWLDEVPSRGFSNRAVIAARQTHGRGQYGRSWQSPMGGVWISAATLSFGNLKSMQLLGLAYALSMSKRLESLGIPVKIKWPNDLLVFKKKLAGFLPRLSYRGNSLRVVRLGIGMNIYNKVPSNAISLANILGEKNINISYWAAESLIAFNKSMMILQDEDYICKEVEKRIWSSSFKFPGSNENWEIEGINNNGSLVLNNGREMKILSNNN